MDGHYPKLRHWLNSVTNLEIRQDFCLELLKDPGRFAFHTSKRFRKWTLFNLELPCAAWVLRGSRTERFSVMQLDAPNKFQNIQQRSKKNIERRIKNRSASIFFAPLLRASWRLWQSWIDDIVLHLTRWHRDDQATLQQAKANFAPVLRSS